MGYVVEALLETVISCHWNAMSNNCMALYGSNVSVEVWAGLCWEHDDLSDDNGDDDWVLLNSMWYLMALIWGGLENLEKSGNLTLVRENSGKLWSAHYVLPQLR